MICWISEILIFDFLAFAEAICVLACAKDNNSKSLNPTVNLSNLNGVSEELWEIVSTLLKNKKNQKAHFLHFLIFSLFTEIIDYFSK